MNDELIVHPFKPLSRDEDLSHETVRAILRGDEPEAPEPRPLEPGDPGYQERVRSLFREVFHPWVDEEKLLPYRLFVAWRITREMARHKHLLTLGESLADGLAPTNSHPDPWVLPHQIQPTFGTHTATLDHGLLEVINEVRGTAWVDHPVAGRREKHPLADLSDDGLYARYRGVPILPPPIPCPTPEGYDPADDAHLGAWIRVVERTARFLRLRDGSPLDPELGVRGLKGLLDPARVRRRWPNRTQLLTFETLIVQEALDSLLERGVQGTRRHFFDRYALRTGEADGLIKLARRAAAMAGEGSIEEERGLMVLRLEAFAQRARTGLDLKAELGAIKQLALIQGLTNPEQGDTMSDMLKVITSVARERRQVEAQAPAAPALPPPPPQ